MITTHTMEKKTATGHGSWHQCTQCGATKHSGHWWLAGYKSKIEPPCSQTWPNKEWTDKAYPHDGKYQ